MSTSKTLTPDQLTIPRLEKRLKLIHLSIIGTLILLCVYLNLSYSIFHNLILLPCLGFLGYLFFSKVFLVPLITILPLSIVILIQSLIDCIGYDNWLSALTSACIESLFSIIPYFILCLAGSAVALLLVNCTRTFKQLDRIQRLIIILFYVIIGVVIIGLISTYMRLVGNPINSLYAKAKMQSYLSTTYKDLNTSLHRPQYSFKFGSYSADAYIYTDEESRPFSIHYNRSGVWDDYFELYLEDMQNSNRLSHEASTQISELLSLHHIPYTEVQAYIRVPQDKYDKISFSSTTVSEPLSLTILKLTDAKESYTEFATWCETIRQVLVDSGYTMQDISLESDPHLLINRLSLSLSQDELASPITTVEGMQNFIDYGKSNNIDQLPLEEYQSLKSNGKFNTYYDKSLSEELASLLSNADLEVDEVKASLSGTTLDIDINWYGDRILPDDFAVTCIAIRDRLFVESDRLSGYTPNYLSFNYYWGTSHDSYHYNSYEDNILDLDTATIVNDLLKFYSSNKFKY